MPPLPTDTTSAPITTLLRRLLRWTAWTAGVLVVGFVLWVAISIGRDEPVTYDDVTEHYRYGSIGSEPGVSLLRPVGGILPPYWVFRALPSICPEKLPGGYASLGFIVEPGRELPIGVAR